MNSPTTKGVSVGQLIAMNPEIRAAVIKKLSPDARFALAHLASLGATRGTEKAREHLDNGHHETWVREHLAHAGQCAEIAAALTNPTEL